jgi:hypothetical protein
LIASGVEPYPKIFHKLAVPPVGKGDKTVTKEIKINKKCRRELLKKPNVVGVGVGYRTKGGQQTGDQAIMVFVTEKKPRDELAASDMVPHSMQGQQVDVVEIGEVRFLEEDDEAAIKTGPDRLKKYRPVRCGVSIGHYKITAGTLGAVVRDRASGAQLILSNNHVLANSSAGNDGRASPGDAVLQPGPYDGGIISTDMIGRLERFVPLKRTFQPAQCMTAHRWEGVANKILKVLMPPYRVTLQRSNNKSNLVDAALAKPDREADLSGEILELGQVNGVAEASLGQEIAFSGRTSGVVRGRVIARDVGLYIAMEPGEQVYFEQQLVTSAVSRPGDSGSLLLDTQNRAVGLLFAGSDRVSICNTIENVNRLLGIEFA